ncbi:hypothetical protein T492DRAFT_1039860 [Pavlovales sp. CCMP2436]|nr:hypothetical protein T492DRAFT_1039860 [Pavlovales sp. CCMP2436]
MCAAALATHACPLCARGSRSPREPSCVSVRSREPARAPSPCRPHVQEPLACADHGDLHQG